MTYRLGRRGAVRPVGLADLPAYSGEGLPPAPPTCAAPKGVAWGLLGNDTFGDCTIAGVVHLRMAVAAEHLETETFPTSAEVVTEYFKLSHGQDSGLVEANVLHTWHTAGLFGDRIAGYAPLDHRNPDELCSAVHTFGGAYLGVALPAPAQTQFADGQPWDLTGTPADRNIVGGHCIVACGYDPHYLYVVTWGKVQPVTWAWVGAYLEEAWGVITEELAEAAGVDLDALQADLSRLG